MPRSWLHEPVHCAVALSNKQASCEEIRQMHARHHFGVDRTLFSMMQPYPELVTRRKDVEKVISACVPCRSVDPAAERWPKGDVSVEED